MDNASIVNVSCVNCFLCLNSSLGVLAIDTPNAIEDYNNNNNNNQLTFNSENASTTYLVADTASFVSVYSSDIISATNVSMTNASITDISVSGNASFVSLYCNDTVSSMNVSTTNACITHLTTSGNVSFVSVVATNLSTSSNASFVSLYCKDTTSTTNLCTTNACITHLTTLGNASFVSLHATDNVSSMNVSATNACITNLSTSNASFMYGSCTQLLTLNNVSATNLSSTNAFLYTVCGTNVCVVNLSCTTGSFNSASIQTVYSQNAYFMNTYSGYSDDRAKIISFNLSNCLDKISSLSTFQYYPNGSLFEQYDISYVNKPELGLSAQEIDSMFPEVVNLAPCDVVYNSVTHEQESRTGLNLLTIQYERLVPVIIQALQELKVEVEEIKKELTSITQK